jgi:hypothetical protein
VSEVYWQRYVQKNGPNVLEAGAGDQQRLDSSRC